MLPYHQRAYASQERETLEPRRVLVEVYLEAGHELDLVIDLCGVDLIIVEFLDLNLESDEVLELAVEGHSGRLDEAVHDLEEAVVLVEPVLDCGHLGGGLLAQLQPLVFEVASLQDDLARLVIVDAIIPVAHHAVLGLLLVVRARSDMTEVDNFEASVAGAEFLLVEDGGYLFVSRMSERFFNLI